MGLATENNIPSPSPFPTSFPGASNLKRKPTENEPVERSGFGPLTALSTRTLPTSIVASCARAVDAKSPVPPPTADAIKAAAPAQAAVVLNNGLTSVAARFILPRPFFLRSGQYCFNVIPVSPSFANSLSNRRLTSLRNRPTRWTPSIIPDAKRLFKRILPQI